MPVKHRRIPTLTPQDIQRFWSKVDKTPGYGPKGKCWRWTAALDNGYGLFRMPDGNYRASRIAYYLANKIDPLEMEVCHTCDYCCCCNPDHLFLGTQADNAADRNAKGRQAKGTRHGSYTHPERWARGERHRSRTHPESLPRGETHYKSKLTNSKVVEIRELHTNGTTTRELANMYGVSISLVQRVVQRKAWGHIA